MSKPKVLLLDLESLANTAHIFGIWDGTKPDMVMDEKSIVTFAYKWLGDKAAKVITISDFTKPRDDKTLVQAICILLEEADYVVAHFGDAFDLKFIRARALINNLNPPPIVPSIDTYKLVKKHFNFNSNKLDYVGKILGLGRKKATSWSLWEKCAKGDPKAIKEMAAYNKQDVELLEAVFLKILPHVESKLNHNLFSHKEGIVCKNCGSHKIQKRGFLVNTLLRRQRYNCQDCGAWFSTKLTKNGE